MQTLERTFSFCTNPTTITDGVIGIIGIKTNGYRSESLSHPPFVKDRKRRQNGNPIHYMSRPDTVDHQLVVTSCIRRLLLLACRQEYRMLHALSRPPAKTLQVGASPTCERLSYAAR